MGGDLDIYNVGAAREALLVHLAEKPALDLDLGGVETCDAAGFQLLLAAHRSARAAGKEFCIQTRLPPSSNAGCSLACHRKPGRRTTINGMSKIILTVDDSASMREMIGFTLRNAGYQFGSRGRPRRADQTVAQTLRICSSPISICRTWMGLN